MKKLLTSTLILALMAPLTPLSAGDKAKKNCPENAADCARMMSEQFKERGWVGINMEYDKESGASYISNVVANSPAERAGFEEGDVLKGLNGIDYSEENEQSLKAEYAAFRPGNKVTFKVARDGKMMDIEVVLEQIPQAILAQWVGQHVLEFHQGEAEVAAVEEEKSGESP